MDPDTLWQAALGELEVVLSSANYITWFKGLFIVEINDSTLILGVPSKFAKEWLEKKFHQQILDTINRLTDGKIINIEYQIASHNKTKENYNVFPLINRPVDNNSASTKSARDTQQIPKLNPKYTFANFIVGSSNRMAHAAAQAVANNPGHSYNPLFLYGGVGLGKTHLIQAIAHEVINNYPEKKIIYTSCEQFINDFIDSVRLGKASEFKHRYRDIDLLLIDDIQFLAGKESTQEEFFHTFNSLHQRNNQIIITSDRLPKAIPTLEERLSSRFEMGLTVDVNLPDFETRCAIIQSKTKEKDFDLNDNLVEYIAQSIPSNIRELEGALNRLIAHCELTKSQPSEEIIQATLSQFITSSPKKSLSVNKIIKIISSHYNINIEDLMGAKRKDRKSVV